MRAATIVDGRVEVRDHPDPQPGPHEVLVRVHAAGVNNADLLQTKGFYPAPPGVPADIPGLELAGEVVAVGEDDGLLNAGEHTCRFQPGDKVMGITAGGAQAELAVVHELALMPVPDGVDWPTAGGFPEGFFTAYDALLERCSLSLFEAVLISGAAGGVGSAAVQLARQWQANVTASVRNKDLWDDVKALGADTVVAPDDIAANAPYDVVIELIGSPNMPANIEALDDDGRIAVIGVGAGARFEVDLLTLMRKRATITAATLRARPIADKGNLARGVERDVLPMLAEGRVRVPITATFPLDDVAAAYERFAQGGKLGKIVLTL